jgi:hypothetical protein
MNRKIVPLPCASAIERQIDRPTPDRRAWSYRRGRRLAAHRAQSQADRTVAAPRYGQPH